MSSINEDPFQDPSVSGQSSVHRNSGDVPPADRIVDGQVSRSEKQSHLRSNTSPRKERIVKTIPQPPQAAHIRNSASPHGFRPHQVRHVSSNTQRSSHDEILPITSREQSVDSTPFRKPWMEKHTSLTDSTTSTLSTRRPAPEAIDRSPEILKKGNRWITITKWFFIVFVVSTNTFFIFATWWWPKYYYVFLPLITITVALNVIMVFSIILHLLFRKVVPEVKYLPETPESMVMVLPCYNETREELTKSLDSLVGQIGIEDNQKAIMIICDGKVRGPGMEKTTGDYLLEDILTHPATREYIDDAYTSWDHTPMDAVVQTGTYSGIPYVCIVKESNRGKRDSLILIRSFLYNFNIRDTRPSVILSDYFFMLLVSFLCEAGMSKVDLLIGMDADTFFEPRCIAELIKQSHYKHTIGVCGYVAVDFGSNSWSLWRLYQNAEYTISQCLRRLHQSIATHKVSCLPGCCQLLKVCETTCGDRILLELFGYHPTATDHLLKQIRATASEDRNHVCLMLSAFPKARTRQAINARAYTDVPHSWSVFLSQRRRWTLGATSNDFLLMFAPGILLFERILATANVITWVLNLFIIACIASFIKACTFVHYSLILAFVSVMLVPVLYYILIVVWQPRNMRERIQYLAGLCMYVFLGPFLNITVLLFALRGIDNFGWGKTRKVVQTADTSSNEQVLTEKPPTKLTKPRPGSLISS